MTDVTVHITVPRQLWDTGTFELDLDEHDKIVGRFIREAAAEGESTITRRVSGGIRIAHIEITLADSATSAEAES